MPVGGPKSAWIESARCFPRGPTLSPICRGLSRAPRPGPQPLKGGIGGWKVPQAGGSAAPVGCPMGAALPPAKPRRAGPFLRGRAALLAPAPGAGRKVVGCVLPFLSFSMYLPPVGRRPSRGGLGGRRGPAGIYDTHNLTGCPRGANLGLLPNYCGWDLPVQFTFTSLNSCSSKARLMVKPSTLSFTVQASALCQTGIITLASAR